jgi:hypothetical protein
MTEPAKRIAAAIRRGAAREHERRGPGRRRATVLDTTPLKVDLHGTDLTLEGDDVALGKTVRATGVAVGDVLVLVEVDRDEWVAVDVEGP